MAVDMFIRIGAKGDGDAGGEAADKEHSGEIDVLSWSWGMTQSGTAHIGGGSGAGKVSVQDLTLTKYVDKATPKLMQSCCNGKHYDDAVLTVRKAGENPITYLVITMKQVLITNVSTGGSGGEDRLTENVTLNFGSVELDYYPQTSKGGQGTKIPMTWDIAKNTK